MRFCENLSTERESKSAIFEICEAAQRDLAGAVPDLGFLFFTGHHAGSIERIVDEVRDRLGLTRLLGCSAESVIGGGREIEREPALVLWLASLPGTSVETFRLECRETPDGFCFPVTPSEVFDRAPEDASLLLLGEPFSLPGDLYLRRFNEDHPGVPVLGGMASGATSPGQSVLLHDGAVVREGAVGALLCGAARVRAVVSQGCRPIAEPLVVTDCDRNAILKLGGKPALACVQEILGRLSEEDRRLFRGAPHIGVAMTENREKFGAGDFLIRNVVGVDPAQRAVFVSDYVRRGQTVQLHVRDGAAADADLKRLLAREIESGGSPRGALLFSCNGRGRRMFGGPDHDVTAVLEKAGRIPVSGFFAQGELGPVGGRNHLHGFTACVALFS